MGLRERAHPETSVIIDHQNKAYGRPVPYWVMRGPGIAEAQREFQGKAIIRAEFSSTDIASARQFARGFDAKWQIVTTIGDMVNAKAEYRDPGADEFDDPRHRGTAAAIRKT